jgi:hypothetical protein
MPATRPSSTATSTPATPEPSPAAKIPSTVVRIMASRTGTQPPSRGTYLARQPASSPSSVLGTKPKPTTSRSTSTRCCRARSGCQSEAETGPYVTLRNTLVPCAWKMVWLYLIGMPASSSPSRYRAPSVSSPRCRHALATIPGRNADRPASSTATTLTPVWCSWFATTISSGPVPATSARSPGLTRMLFINAWAPPAVRTPGSVQPGKGTGRS